MSEPDVPPAVVAQWDQAIAGSVDYLEDLIRAFWQVRHAGGTEEVTVMALAVALAAETPAEVLSGTLAVAVMRLAVCDG